ncbi:MAG: hypothetical protein AAB516_01485 [Patescibacteria group bacterium]
MKFESLDNLKPKEITEKEAQDSENMEEIAEELEEDKLKDKTESVKIAEELSEVSEQELINPELRKIEDERNAIRKEMDLLLNESVDFRIGLNRIRTPELFIKRDKEGKIIYLKSNLEQPEGLLGEKLNNKNPEYNTKKYYDNVEFQKIVDKFLDLKKSKEELGIESEKIMEAKRLLYKKGENINSFLEKAGLSVRVDEDFNIEGLLHKANLTENLQGFKKIIKKIYETADIFADIEISKDQEKDFGKDLTIIERILLRASVDVGNIANKKVKFPQDIKESIAEETRFAYKWFEQFRSQREPYTIKK